MYYLTEPKQSDCVCKPNKKNVIASAQRVRSNLVKDRHIADAIRDDGQELLKSGRAKF